MKTISSFFLIVMFISSLSAQITDSDSDLGSTVYNTKLSWNFDSIFMQSLVQEYSDGEKFLTYEIDSSSKLISYQLFFSSGAVALKSKLVPFSSEKNSAKRFFYETITYYNNGNLRTIEYVGAFQAYKTGYSENGKEIYHSRVINNDTLSGLFLKPYFNNTESHYSYYELSILKYTIVVEPYTFNVIRVYNKEGKTIKRKKTIAKVSQIMKFR